MLDVTKSVLISLEVELGAVPLAALVVATDFTSDRLGFMVRKQAKGRGGRKTNNPPGIEGASIANGGRVIILEDRYNNRWLRNSSSQANRRRNRLRGCCCNQYSR